MKAPEKIYCGNNGHGNLSYSNQMFPNAFEYTRTDALIEKAQKWLAEIHRVCDITDENGYRIDLRELQARFEQYMKGG